MKKGSTTPALLIISATLITALFAILTMLALQLDFSHRQISYEESLYIAEAGIEYYKWHLSQDPLDFTDSTGLPGPYIHEYQDSQGRVVGEFSLEIEGPDTERAYITIASTGYTTKNPRIKRTIKVQYGSTSIARFSFVSNSSIWYGEGTTIKGDVHSNNGVRMDGVSNSKITSSKDEYKCGWETGCEPSEWKPGVWGSGQDSSLWEFPVSGIDFETISFDLVELNNIAQEEGIYLGSSGEAGYHLVFTPDKKVTITKVTKLGKSRGYLVPGLGLGGQGQGCRNIYHIIEEEELVGTYDLGDIDIIYSEDYVWIEGTIDSRLTIAVASLPIESSKIDVYIPGSITYSNWDGSNALGIIAENNIIITRDVPDVFEIDAIIMSQNGNVIRHGYFDWCGGTEGALKQKLTINGSIVSFQKAYWNYEEGPLSGFQEVEFNYDANLIFYPPPLLPTFGEYELISWTEE